MSPFTKFLAASAAALALLGAAEARSVRYDDGGCVSSSDRTAGTLVGAALYLVLAFLPLPVWALGVVLGLLQFAIELVVVRHYALALVFITPLVLLIIGAATGDAASIPLAFERVVDTLVGAAIGTAAALAVRLRLD